MRIIGMALAGALLLVGCELDGKLGGGTNSLISGDRPPTEVDTAAPGTPGDTGEEGTDSATTTDTEESSVSYHRDVRPILETTCNRCHSEQGLGSGDFSSYENAAAYAPSMLAAIDEGRMPPPAADPACRDYEGSEFMTLEEGARDTLADWIDQGLIEGDPEEYQPVETPQAELAEPDVEVYIPEPYEPTYADANNPGNEYRCFPLDIGHTEDTWITGLAPIIDAEEILHHAVLYKLPREEAEAIGPEGYECMDEFAVVVDMMHGWAPGALPMELPEDKGLFLAEDEMLAVQWHYFEGDNPGTIDQSGYQIRTEPMVGQELYVYPYGPYDFYIPAGEEEYSAGLSYPIPWEGTIYAGFPHMHILGSGYEFSVDTVEDGNVCALRSERYDFDNQLTYTFKEPLDFPAWSWLNMECTWNNSASNPDLIHDPPIDVTWGERTDEEMCFAFILVDFDIPY